jgi:hypothetical protein
MEAATYYVSMRHLNACWKPLQAAHEKQNEENYEHQAQAAAGVIAPRTAVRPSGQRSDDAQQQDNEKNGDDHGWIFAEQLRASRRGCNLPPIAFNDGEQEVAIRVML